MLKLSVIIPVYNEKHTIEKIVDLVRFSPVNKEIIVVDDGSTDGTREVIRKRFSNQAEIHAIFHEKNAGKGKVIRTGIAVASCDPIIILDADLEYNPIHEGKKNGWKDGLKAFFLLFCYRVYD